MERTLFDEDHLLFRDSVRRFFEREVVPNQKRWADNGIVDRDAWRKAGEAGFLCPWLEESYGGPGGDFLHSTIVIEELSNHYEPGFALPLHSDIIVPYIYEFGTDEQKKKWLPGCASGETVTAIAMTEPGTGSDLAAVQATALRDGDHYVIRGQKTWASRGAYAHWMFGLFRTDPASERHRGLSFLLVPLDAPGVTVRPIEKLNRKAAFAEVFFDGARVPVANRLGEEGQGWKVAMSTAGFERGLMLRSPARFQATARRLVELYRENEAACDPALRPTVVDCWMEAEAYTLDTYKTVSRLHAGGKIGFEASLNKIFWSELDLKLHETALAILGERAELRPEAPAAEGVGEWLDGYLFALAGPIYAGTNEIQRNVIAERILGLPRK